MIDQGSLQHPVRESFLCKIVNVNWSNKGGPIKVYVVNTSLFPWEETRPLEYCEEPNAPPAGGGVGGTGPPPFFAEWRYNMNANPDNTSGSPLSSEELAKFSYSVSGMPAPGGIGTPPLGGNYNPLNLWKTPFAFQSSYYQEFIYQKAPIPYNRLAALPAGQKPTDQGSNWTEAVPSINVNWRGAIFVGTVCQPGHVLVYRFTTASTERIFGVRDGSAIYSSGVIDFSGVSLAVTSNETGETKVYNARSMQGRPFKVGGSGSFVTLYCITDNDADKLEERWSNR